MAKSVRLGPVVGLCIGWAIVGCAAPDRGDDKTEAQAATETQSRGLTTSLFQPFVAYATGSRPAAVAIGDLDGDGRNDVALLTSYNNDPANDYTVHVFLQDTDGSLKPRVKYPVGGNSAGISIDIGDVNGDGRADVVVGSGGVRVFLQNASGTLDPVVTYPTANSYQIKVGDFNGDGRMDVAGINWGTTSDALDVFLQTETGTLAAPVTYHVPHGGYDELDAGDVDGDGRTDLVVMSGQGLPNVSVVPQLPDGTLGTPTSYSVGNVSTHGVALGDVNGDGRSDIVVSYGGNRPNTFIARFLQNAAGGMDPAVSYPSYDFPTGVVLADVDADGRKDAVVAHDNGFKLGVYRQFPSGDFVSEELFTIGNGYKPAPQALAVGDISGDGRADVVVVDSFNGLVVLRHVPDTSLALAVTAPTPSGGPYYVGAPVTVRWAAGDNVVLAGFDLSVSFNNGTTYTPIAGCTGLPATATECTWTPTQSGSGVRVRVAARDGAGNTASSETTFSPVAASITVTAPTSNQFVGVGLTTNITWSHNLPATSTVRIELSRDGGATYESLSDSALIGGASSGSFAWSVTGPTTSTARVRVTANGSLPASGTTNFAIATAPTLTVNSPFSGSSVFTIGFGAAWTSNAGNVGTVRIELSRDGGSTFETIADSIPNTGSFMGAVSGPGSANARVRVTLSVSGADSVSAISSTFNLVEPSVTVTGPAAGATVMTGTTGPITWTSTVPFGWTARVELSRDGGATYETLTSGAQNTGSFTWSVTGAATTAARVRVTLSGQVGPTTQGSVAATGGQFTIATPTVTVTSPTAGATLFTGAAVTITWSSNLPTASFVRLQLSRDGGATFGEMGMAMTNTGSYAWVVTGPATNTAVIRVTVGNTPGTSGAFAIAMPTVTVTSPGSGLLYVGAPTAITWSTNLPAAAPVTIQLSRNSGSTYEVLATNAPNTGSFSWVVTGPATTSGGNIRVTIGGPVPAVGTGGLFGIVVPSLTVTSPAAGAAVYAGTSLTVTWSSAYVIPATPVSVELSRDGGFTYETVAASTPNIGSFSFFVAGPATSSAVVRVTATDPVAVSSTSGAFSITLPLLSVTGPSAGTVAYAGTPVTITWTDNLSAGDPVSIELSRDGGATYAVLIASTPDTGSFVWTASGPDTATARFRVMSIGSVPAGDVSPPFQIVTPTMAVTSPAAGENWVIGTSHTISWSSNLPAGTTALVELSRDGGSTWATLASAVSGGSLAWTATAPAASSALVRVTANGGVPASATSSAFVIGNPSLTVSSPAAGAKWTIGTAQTIAWTTNLPSSATVTIELSRNGGSTYTTLATAAPNSGSFAWTATGATSTTAKVRVSVNGFSATSVSGTFSLVAASVTVTSPNTAVTWTVGTVHAITWNHNLGASAQFKIEVSRSGVWSTITSAVTGGGATTGSYQWTVAAPRTSTAKIRVTWTGNTTVTDSSDVAFRIN